MTVSAPLAADPLEPDQVDFVFAQTFGAEFHPAFREMRLNCHSFDSQWDRDYRVMGNCPQGEMRGGLPYYPPRGFLRFGLNVTGRFDRGDDRWLGMSNVPGEWAVFYHGTPGRNVKSIIETPLHVGRNNSHGAGIYCSTNASFASQYSQEFQVQTSAGWKKYRYVFMCRANPRSICNCTEEPCPSARDPVFTLHKTRMVDLWFVNGNNCTYEHIRPYGLLILEN
jgi:hypothetical protein